MQTETMLSEGSFERRVLERIASLGALKFGYVEVAQVLGCSIASLYRHFRGWGELMAYVHAEVIEALDPMFECPRSTRRAEFEQWWGVVSQFLGSRDGLAFRVLRACASSGGDVSSVEKGELERLRSLSRLLGRQPLPPGRSKETAARSIWSMVLMAVSSHTSDDERRELRELAWRVIENDERTLH